MGKVTIHDILTSPNRNGDTSLHISARNGHVELLKSLHLNYGLSLNSGNNEGKRPLHEAAQNGHIDCVEYMIRAGCHVDSLKRADWTPLMLACSKSDLKMVETLLKYNANLCLVNKDGWSSFHIAARYPSNLLTIASNLQYTREGAVDILTHLMSIDATCCHTVSNNMRTPLHTASLHGQNQVIKFLYKQCGVDINVKDSCGVTPLMDAVRGNHLQSTQLLVQFGADINSQDVLGRSCVHHGAQAGSVDALKYLISEGCDVTMATSKGGMTPLHYAAKEGQSLVINLLLKHGACVNTYDMHGRTALDIARNARNGTETVKILTCSL